MNEPKIVDSKMFEVIEQPSQSIQNVLEDGRGKPGLLLTGSVDFGSGKDFTSFNTLPKGATVIPAEGND